MLEEVDADRAISEIVRVTRPGGRVGIIVRAADIPWVINVPVSDMLKRKVEAGYPAAVEERGCSDASLYARARLAGLGRLKMFPTLAPWDQSSPLGLRTQESIARTTLDEGDLAEWSQGVAKAKSDGTIFFAQPHHCVVGTKPDSRSSGGLR